MPLSWLGAKLARLASFARTAGGWRSSRLINTSVGIASSVSDRLLPVAPTWSSQTAMRGFSATFQSLTGSHRYTELVEPGIESGGLVLQNVMIIITINKYIAIPRIQCTLNTLFYAYNNPVGLDSLITILADG